MVINLDQKEAELFFEILREAIERTNERRMALAALHGRLSGQGLGQISTKGAVYTETSVGHDDYPGKALDEWSAQREREMNMQAEKELNGG